MLNVRDFIVESQLLKKCCKYTICSPDHPISAAGFVQGMYTLLEMYIICACKSGVTFGALERERQQRYDHLMHQCLRPPCSPLEMPAVSACYLL